MYERIMVMVVIAGLMLALGFSLGCSVRHTKPDDGQSLVTPMSIYYAAQGGMIALANENPTLATIVCKTASEKVWPILEGASGATIELKDEVVEALTEAAEAAGLKKTWLKYMAPGLGFLNATFQPEIVFQDDWLAILKGFVGGVIDYCEGTDTHRPEGA